MLNVAIRLCFILVVFGLWVVLTYWAGSSVRQIWNIRNVDSSLTLRLVGKALTKNPFASLVEQVRERVELELTWTPEKGYTFSPHGGEVITEDFLRDRRQYRLVVVNPSKESLAPVELRVQLPYPVDRSEVAGSSEANGVTFQPVGMLMTATVAGGGQVKVMRQPLSPNYELRIAELLPAGRVEILIVLNSWRDPRGKTVPKEEAARYFVPEWGPSVTYIHGHFKYRVGSQAVTQEYYAPFELRDDKTVMLGSPGPPPERLATRIGWE